jgi:hypothetical protein
MKLLEIFPNFYYDRSKALTKLDFGILRFHDLLANIKEVFPTVGRINEDLVILLFNLNIYWAEFYMINI